MSKTTTRNVLIASVLLLLSIGVFGYMLFASESKNTLLREQLVTLEKKRVQEESYLQMRRLLEDSVPERETVAAMFLEQESDSIDFLNLVEQLAEDNGIFLQTKDLTVAEDKKKKTKSLNVSFSFNGERQRVQDFIEVLENLPFLSEITKVDYKARSATNWEANVSTKVNLYEYAE